MLILIIIIIIIIAIAAFAFGRNYEADKVFKEAPENNPEFEPDERAMLNMIKNASFRLGRAVALLNKKGEKAAREDINKFSTHYYGRRAYERLANKKDRTKSEENWYKMLKDEFG